MVIALMASCGVYDGSGTFASKIGILAKSGVGGGILTAVPGKMGIATYGPALDPAGNSCFGLYALERISKDEELGILSRPQISFSLKNYDTVEPLDELVEQTALRATSGKVVSYIPELAKVLPENRGVSLSTLDGVIVGGGQHSDFRFTMQAVACPFLWPTCSTVEALNSCFPGWVGSPRVIHSMLPRSGWRSSAGKFPSIR